ncbi:5'-3' exoribonuclease 1-like [Copidosoma floridanum]|uniref:5'-3' exoribonuclease 1-like n=1 Tax=Copidosoma floridanum TaxID=29053 RepID=UPI000C6F9871|nr:5'-3' exoribonuclease 1-like [Copidosoma floridanum]
MFLAFDGVTPRAKINQQRATRFRVSKKFDDDNELGEQQELLDTNCITPGTTFMAELIEHMRHFVAYKISTDPMWQGCKIILSGPEVPGEGEHKIMQYIRYEKTLNTYDCNTRHCVYSIDADMIVLGLCCRIVHFSLIQETIRFGKRKLLLTPEESEFHLLHLCVLREYLQKEFGYLFDDRGIVGFDSEKIIDDWVLLGFLVGNDFVPQLPKLNIVDGALPFLYKIYVDVFPNLNGYINESGVLNLKRFEMFLKYLFSFEKKLESESSAETRFLTNSNDDGDKFADVPLKTAINSDIQTNLRLQDLKLDDSECSTKSEYYKTKLKVTNFEESDVKVMVTEYVRAVQWTLAYYYQGCISWSWYYPYHYAPHISLAGGITTYKQTLAAKSIPNSLNK